METIDVTEFHRRMKAQGVSSREHIAFKCPICSTVQSMASLIRAGDSQDAAEKHIGFSCEGRVSGSGEWPSKKDNSAKAKARRLVRGCNWTLGGLFQLHNLTVTTPSGDQPSFELATPDEAKELEAKFQSVAA